MPAIDRATDEETKWVTSAGNPSIYSSRFQSLKQPQQRGVIPHSQKSDVRPLIGMDYDSIDCGDFIKLVAQRVAKLLQRV